MVNHTFKKNPQRSFPCCQVVGSIYFMIFHDLSCISDHPTLAKLANFSNSESMASPSPKLDLPTRSFGRSETSESFRRYEIKLKKKLPTLHKFQDLPSLLKKFSANLSSGSLAFCSPSKWPLWRLLGPLSLLNVPWTSAGWSPGRRSSRLLMVQNPANQLIW